MRPSALVIAMLLLAVVVAACAEAPAPSATERPFPNSVFPGATRGPGPDVDCSRLLTEEEVEAAVGTEVTPLGWNRTSCYWRTSTGVVQVVMMTGPEAGLWFGKLTESGSGDPGMKHIAGYDFDAIASAGRFGGSVPGRAALVHGIADQDAAATLIRLVLTRL
jgi:hypothetical protein